MNELGNKSYKLFLVWLLAVVVIAVTVVLILDSFVPDIAGNVMSKIITEMIAFALSALMMIIYFSDKIYWFNGMSYEEASSMSKEKRRLYAQKHMRLFHVAFIIITVYNIIGVIGGSPVEADYFVALLAIVISALRSILIKK